MSKKHYTFNAQNSQIKQAYEAKEVRFKLDHSDDLFQKVSEQKFVLSPSSPSNPTAGTGAGATLPTGEYRFEFADDQVTGVFKRKGVTLKAESIDSNETFTLQADGSVIKQEVERFKLETTRYVDSDGDGFFNKVSEVETHAVTLTGVASPELHLHSV